MESLLVPNQATRTIPGTRILVLAPHPDDEVFGCGGAIMRHVAQGNPVHVIIFTNGAYCVEMAGGVAPAERADYIARRQGESIAAAKVLGYGIPEFRSHEDRALHYSEKLVHEILVAIEATNADLVYAPSVYEIHPDHRALAIASVEAVRRCGKVVKLALYEVGLAVRPNLLLDITDLAARKLEAMQCFGSQIAKQRYDLDVAALNRFRSYTLPASATAAEAYILVSAEELNNDPLGLYRSEHARQQALGLPMDSSDFPLVSVIIRSMDRPCLSDALDSVALQTCENIEVLVVNATGLAHSALDAWCGRYPLRMINPGRALSRSAAANCGLEAAQGEFVIFLDDDDYFLPHHVSRLLEEFKGGTTAIAAYSAISCVDPSGKEVRRFAEVFDADQFRIQNFIPIHAVLFRRAGLDRGARFDETLQVCEDWDFWLQLQEQGSFRFVPETGAIYRMENAAGSGVWSDPDATRKVMLQIYRKWMPRWSDAALWSMFAMTRYKPLYEELAQVKAQLEVEVAEGAARIVALEQESGQLKQALADQTNALAAQDHALTRQKDALKERDERIDSLLNSTSWRITSPLRKLVAFIRGNGGSGDKPATPQQATAAPEAGAPPKHVYDYAVDPTSQTAPAFVYQLVGPAKRVLEIGCGPGSITKMLKQLGQCRVTGIEIDPAAIKMATPFCEAIYQADLNADNWPSVLGSAPLFDTVVAADVLEHLYDPWKTLRMMATLIHPKGSLVISLPHAGHAAIASCLINGNFRYHDWGLLDRTHIRFFGLQNIQDLFVQAGLKIVEVRYVITPPEETELADSWLKLPESVRTALKLSKHADIYQVVVRAVPATQPGAAVSLVQPG